MTIRISGLTALALLAPFVVAGAARANPAVSFDASSPTAPAGEGLEVGWGFTPTVGITVTALGAYDPTNMGGTNPSGMVYLYNSMGTTLASVQITIGDSKEGTPSIMRTSCRLSSRRAPPTTSPRMSAKTRRCITTSRT